MDIAFVYDAVYPYVRGGAERRYYEFGRRLADRGHTVRHISWQYWDGPSVQRNADGVWLHGVGRPHPLHDSEGRRTFRQAARFAARLLPAIARLPKSLIDCSSIPYTPALAMSPIAGRKGHRMAVTWHEYMGDRWPSYAGRRATVARAVERRAAARGALRIAVSSFTRDRLPPGPRTTVVANGIDWAGIQAVRAVATPVGVVAVGRLVPHKRTDLLLQAMALLPEVTARIIGEGPERPRLERLAHELHLSDRVSFCGGVDSDIELIAQIKSAGALVLTSEQEGFGMTVLEAMAAGTPPVVVRSVNSGAADLITDGQDGLLCESAPSEVARGIASIVNNPQRRAELAAHAATSSRAYDWDALTEQLLGAYARIAPIRHVKRTNIPSLAA
jgi:glycosyltransferase involved in cell wall biosynthesis